MQVIEVLREHIDWLQSEDFIKNIAKLVFDHRCDCSKTALYLPAVLYEFPRDVSRPDTTLLVRVVAAFCFCLQKLIGTPECSVLHGSWSATE